MRKLLYISLLIVAVGCQHLTAPSPDKPTNGDLSYAWPDKDTVLTYRSSSGDHIITLTKGGAISDKAVYSGTSTRLVPATSDGNYTLAGLTTNDLFGFAGDVQIQVTPTIIPIRSIASMNGIVYALSDTAIYQYDPSDNSFKWVGSTPKPSLTLFEDRQPGKMRLFAAALGGGDVWMLTLQGPSSNIKWTPIFTAPVRISTILSDRAHDGDAIWFASDNMVFRYSMKKGFDDKGVLFSDVVTSLDEGRLAYSDAIVGLRNGNIGVIHDDTSTEFSSVPSEITGIALGLVASRSGLFDILGLPQPSSKPIRDDLSNVFPLHPSNGQDVAVAFADGRMAEFDNGIVRPLGTPVTGIPVQQFATAGPNSTDFFALAGNQVWIAQGMTWKPVRAIMQSAPPIPKSASIVLLSTDTAWTTTLTQDLGNGNSVGIIYNASVIAPASAVRLDDIDYSDVLTVNYVPTGQTTASPGVTLVSATMPGFTIYYQRGVGPIRIQRVMNGVSTVTSLVK
jgi:hypothetical protein